MEPCNDLFLEEKSRFRVIRDDLSALREKGACKPEQRFVVPALHARIGILVCRPDARKAASDPVK